MSNKKQKINLFISILCLVGPWKFRRFLYNKIMGYKLSKTSFIGYSIINPNYLEMGENSRIGNLNIIKGLDKVVLENNAVIGKMNQISGYPSSEKIYFQKNPKRFPELILGKHTHITNRHIIDCSDKISIGDFTIVAGYRSQLLTHEIDFIDSKQTASPISIGKYCFISTDCTLLKGAVLPDYSILAAKSLLKDSYQTPNYLYGGIPAKPLKYLDFNKTKYFQRKDGIVY
jgi:acetyltransferase-like isoleucine patch superfamily enzyme